MPSAVTPGGHRDVVDATAVVRAIADLQMAERVEVRAELRRARDHLGDPVHAVVADAAHVRVVRGRHERLVESAAREDRDVLVEHAAEVVRGASAARATAPATRFAAVRWLSIPSSSSAPNAEGHQRRAVDRLHAVHVDGTPISLQL